MTTENPRIESLDSLFADLRRPAPRPARRIPRRVPVEHTSIGGRLVWRVEGDRNSGRRWRAVEILDGREIGSIDDLPTKAEATSWALEALDAYHRNAATYMAEAIIEGDPDYAECPECELPMSEDLICLDSQYGRDGCEGPVDWHSIDPGRVPAHPRCERHWDLKLLQFEDMRARYPDSDVAPDWFDPLDAGERWDDDY